MKRKALSIFLIVNGILLAAFTIGRVYYLPNTESGIVIDNLSHANTSTLAAASLPSRLLIPKLDIDADVQRLGVEENGNMAAPNNFTDVSWYKYGTPPGHPGSAVMAGHVDNALGLDGVFKKLEDLEIGDDVYVVLEDGERVRFRVTGKEIYPYDNVPLEDIFHASDGTYLNLITCAGDWLASARTNDQRLVVYTELAN